MIEHHLNIGDVVTSSRNVSYTCFGLGSCIGLFLQDRITGLSGGAHIFLPEDESGPYDVSKRYNVSSALDEILKQFKSRGSDLTALRAKVVGGANVLGGDSQIGDRNTKSVVSQLVAKKIFIAALDVGGTYCRSAKFQSNTGQLTVRISQMNGTQNLLIKNL
jgi:chemotaxis protein CheD